MSLYDTQYDDWLTARDQEVQAQGDVWDEAVEALLNDPSWGPCDECDDEGPCDDCITKMIEAGEQW